MRYFVFASLLLVGIGMATWEGGGILPSTKPLGKLVTRQQASELHEFYGALASVVESSDAIATTGDFRGTQILAGRIMQDSLGPSASLASINKPINEMLVTAIGIDGEVPDAEIGPEMRRKLVAVLREISEDF